MFASAGRPSTSSCLLPLPVSASIGNYVSLLACACLTVRLSDCLSVQLSVSVYCLFPSICLSVTASLHLNLSVCPYLNLSIACLCLPAYLPVGQSQHLSVCLPAFLCEYVCVSVCPSPLTVSICPICLVMLIYLSISIGPPTLSERSNEIASVCLSILSSMVFPF